MPEMLFYPPLFFKWGFNSIKIPTTTTVVFFFWYHHELTWNRSKLDGACNSPISEFNGPVRRTERFRSHTSWVRMPVWAKLFTFSTRNYTKNHLFKKMNLQFFIILPSIQDPTNRKVAGKNSSTSFLSLHFMRKCKEKKRFS